MHALTSASFEELAIAAEIAAAHGGTAHAAPAGPHGLRNPGGSGGGGGQFAGRERTRQAADGKGQRDPQAVRTGRRGVRGAAVRGGDLGGDGELLE